MVFSEMVQLSPDSFSTTLVHLLRYKLSCQKAKTNFRNFVAAWLNDVKVLLK